MSLFRPLPLLGNPHLQTLLGSAPCLAREPPSTTHLVALPDGDRLALEVSTPSAWREDDTTVLMVHGLCGSHRSPYMVRLASKLVARGLRVVRLNLRGNGSGAGLARKPYHAGASDDLRSALLAVRDDTPTSPIWAIGFSMGGNIVLKLAGELGGEGPAWLAGVVGVCPAVDLIACSRRLSRPELSLYERMFVRCLLDEMARRHLASGDPLPSLSCRPSVHEIDDRYTALWAGFPDAMAYYAAASALPLLPRVGVRCRLLLAEDDPLVDATWLRDAPLPHDIDVVLTATGGHLGFLGLPGGRFMDRVVVDWLR